MQIILDDLSGKSIAEFLEEHINEMRSVSPPESKHALGLERLRKPEITFWTVMDEGHIAGCGAIKELNKHHGEIKSMRTSALYRNRGVASLLLVHIIKVAEERNYERLSLETGSMAFFEPARNLYKKFGFELCEPFADYKNDVNSVFMGKLLK